MEKERKELMDTFGKLDPENRAFLLTYARATYTAQESTKKHFQDGLKALVGDASYIMPKSAPIMEAVNG